MNNYLLDHDYIQGVSLMTSLGCNLNCEYCHIAQAVNPNSKNLQVKTMQALESGEYIETVRQVFQKLHQSPDSVTSLSLWGQEPTLTLHLFTQHLSEWLNLFPNAGFITFSTNTMAYPERIVDFLLTLDKVAKIPMRVSIQLSYDGDYSTNNLRGGSSSKIHDNVTTILTELNKYSFTNLDITFNFHGVISFDLLNKCKDIQSLFNYAKGLGDWGLEFYRMINNTHVHLAHNGVDLSLETPVNADVQMGLDVAQFCRMSQFLNPAEVYKDHHIYHADMPMLPGEYLCVAGEEIFRTIEDLSRSLFDSNSIYHTFDIILNDEKARHDFLGRLNHSLYCSNSVRELKILYDGTLINCQNHIYDTDITYLPKGDNDIKSNVKRALATHNYFVNPLTADDLTLQRYFWLFNSCKNHSLEYIWKTTIISMEFLLHCGQIDRSYYNTKKLLSHALILSCWNCCSYNNQIMTGSIFLRHFGFIRVMCNGLLDLAVEQHLSHSSGGFEF